MYLEEQIKSINESLKIRNQLFELNSIKKAVNAALEIAIEKVNSQTASVFLFSKDGLLRRIGIKGKNRLGIPIIDNWYSEECYEVGASFTGKAVNPSLSSSYGEVQWSNSLQDECIELISKNNYLEALGSLDSAIAVPLNGQHRSFGVLEVINKLDSKRRKKIQGGFSENDIYWLTLIGVNLATTISHLRRKYELNNLFQISQLIVNPFDKEIDENEIFSKVASILVNEITCYKAIMVRLQSLKEGLKVVAKGGDNINWQNWNDNLDMNESSIPRNVLNKNIIIRIEDIESNIDQFTNIDWINTNKLKSYICLPLSVKNKVIGTLSVFVGFKHRFFDSDIQYLESISYLLSAFAIGKNIFKDLMKSEEDKDKFHSEGRAVGYDTALQWQLHSHKHQLLYVEEKLNECQNANSIKKNRILNDLIKELKNEIEKITVELNSVNLSKVDVNVLLQKNVRALNKEILKNNITVKYQLIEDNPVLNISERQINEVFFNIISNSIKAIATCNKKDREILIKTSVVFLNRIEYIRILIKDNGIGIKNEIKEKIFNKNFSTFKDGTGMGLFLAKNILNGFGAKIEVHTTVGKGSSFIIYMPVKRHKFIEVNNGSNGSNL